MSMCVEATRAKLVYVAQAQKLSRANLAPEGFFFLQTIKYFVHFISDQHILYQTNTNYFG